MKKQLLAASLMLAMTSSAFAAKCYNPRTYNENWNGYRQTENMIRINNNDIEKDGNSIISRKTGDHLFLAKIKDNASTQAIASSCNGDGLTPIFQENLCSGEVRTYVIKESLCVKKLEEFNNNRLVRNNDESIDFYPGVLTVWTFEDGMSERVLLFPWTTIADVIILPFASLNVVAEVSDNISRRVGQRRIERRLGKKDVKVNHASMNEAVRTFLRAY
jgi:hypothetical protein